MIHGPYNLKLGLNFFFSLLFTSSYWNPGSVFTFSRCNFVQLRKALLTSRPTSVTIVLQEQVDVELSVRTIKLFFWEAEFADPVRPEDVR